MLRLWFNSDLFYLNYVFLGTGCYTILVRTMVSFALVTRVLPRFSNCNYFRMLSDDGTTPGPTTFVGKSSLSVASRVD